MRYAYVQNGSVVESNRLLPKNWANISNFDLLDSATLKNYGWYEYRFETANVPDGYKIVGRHYEITDNEVIEHEDIEQITPEEIEQRIDTEWKNVRSRRNILLLESDWTQLSDSPLPNQKQTEWQIYRQSLRDITNQTDPFNLSWPTEPVA
jgi:hypothetical protein